MSMQGFNRAIYAFWSTLKVNGKTLPAYLQGEVPDDATFPYITFDVTKTAAFGQVPLSATAWFKKANNDSKLAERSAFFNAAALAIPEAGARVDLPNGFCMLYRSSGDFLSPMSDETDDMVIGCRVGYEVTIYEM